MMTIASKINDDLQYVRKFAPNLVCVKAALIPFDDVIIGLSAGPQPNAADYDPDEEPWFEVSCNDPQNHKGTVTFRFTADSVIAEQFDWSDGECTLADSPREITLDGVFSFLRQLPRPMSSY